MSKVAEEVESLKRTLNRDLNCLRDENRGVRRQALAKFTRVFFSNRKEPPPPAVSRELFTTWLLNPLLDRFSDPIERCRETAIQLVTDFCKLLNQSVGGLEAVDLTPVMDVTIPTIASRLASRPFPETAEELRVMLVKLLALFIKTPSSCKNLRRHFSDVVEILVKAAGDKFHETKKATSACCVDIVRAAPHLVHLQLQQLVKAQVANFTHHHKAVRKSALAAVCRLMLHGSDGVEKLMNETVLPALKGRAHDRNGPVRKMFLAVIAKWLMELPDRRPYEARLVVLLLSGFSDYAPELQRLALAKLNDVGAKVLQEGEDAVAAAEGEGDVDMIGNAGDDAGAGAGAGAGAAAATAAASGAGVGTVDAGCDDDAWRGSDVMPEVFEGARASKGARVVVRRLLHKMLPSVLEDLAEWTADTRANAASLLVTLFCVAEDAVTEHIDDVLAAFVRGTSDDDTRVRASIATAAEIVGRFVIPDAQLAVLLPQARGEVSGLATPEYRSATLEVLSSVVAGMTSEQLRPHLTALARTLVDPALAEDNPPSLRVRLAAVVHNLVKAGRDALAGNQDVCRMLLRAALHAQAGGPDDDVDTLSAATFQLLAPLCDCDSVAAMFRLFARGLAADITPDCAEWTKAHFNRAVFDAWIHTANVSLHGAIDKIVATLRVSLDPSKPADMRLSQLALIKVLLGSVGASDGDGGAADESKAAAEAAATTGDDRAAMDAALRAQAEVLIAHVLLPNMVWRVGRVAATIRKVAVYCFYTLFRRKLVDTSLLRKLYTQLAVPIKTCLGDEDSTTRKWSCLLMQYAYALLVGQCTHEEVSAIYHELVKRLDDSNNQVRIHVCDTLAQFVEVGPPEAYRGTPMEYTADAMLIHMDDPDDAVQQAVCKALKAWGKLAPTFVIPRIQAVRARHRTPRYCDDAIAYLQSVAAATASA